MNNPKKDEEQLNLDIEDQKEGEDVEVTVEEQPENVDSPVEEKDGASEDEFKKAENQTQKRINRLTKKMRDAEANAEEALRFAKQKEQENKNLANKLNQMDTNYVDQYSGRVESQMAQVEANLRAAMEIGDTEAAVKAQKEMATLAVEADRAEQAKRAQERKASVSQQPQAAAPQPQVQPQARPQPPDPKAQAWADKNAWFGNDSAMTYAAFGIHKELVEQEGIDPKTDEYYDELDKRMTEEFPHKFNNGAQSKKPVQNVASASRASSGRSSGKKQVRLNSRQVAIAKKLGVPLEEYAKYVKE
tara:strand:- start:3500 stop:4408 length:909 start_codon:yes stop_codon:yes gene_type:complete